METQINAVISHYLDTLTTETECTEQSQLAVSETLNDVESALREHNEALKCQVNFERINELQAKVEELERVNSQIRKRVTRLKRLLQ